MVERTTFILQPRRNNEIWQDKPFDNIQKNRGSYIEKYTFVCEQMGWGTGMSKWCIYKKRKLNKIFVYKNGNLSFKH